ncbi:outer membrane protein assembly factor BamA [Halieaceae bacterium IMCC14734]|uniref:Outer membrane protein assembly factor BamA n=1 Tax=Candidatus Litorirhabdus singularis TaxID=2518993 RepID=A0ABT3TK25_9GAMM|nr:outer membrane protein assembly factor BamA [Candidatus Litorirhabdus singularis]MCX2982145.1 outer membrane protein assembly factor BamA [Candidatus Litorirhabdus singularis]
MITRFTRFIAAVLLLLPLAQSPQAQNSSFIVSDIRVEGLQRISAGSVFAAMPLAVGDLVDAGLIRSSARALFGTGNFDDIQIGRDGNVLVVMVAERPSISEIIIDGNKAIETEALLDGLKGAGLAEGQVFKRSTLEGMQMELQRQYVMQGRYDAAIETDVIPEPRNRVSVNIDVDEGTVAVIKHINVVGNEIFDDEEIGDLFTLKTTGLLSFFTNDDKYAREKLSGDLEKLTSYYMDRGYLQFSIDSTQVSVAPEKDAVFITANISEGEKFTVDSVKLSGDLVLPEEDLKRFLLVREGQTFSQQMVTSTEEYLTQRLGNEGYNFAKVSGIPEIDEETNTVNMKFFVDPGKRTYVRRISFRGNTKTIDEVLRREMRQMEGAPASSQSIETSRIRLERLGFFKQAIVDTPEVPGHDDLIDVEFVVEEQSSGSIGASFGYAQGTGLILGVNLQQDNFLGSGKRVGIGLNSSSYQDFYNFSYTNPYYTEDGVSRGFNIFYRSTDLEEVNVASYTTDTLGGAVNFGYPIKETERLGFSVGVSNTKITAGRFAVQEIKASPRLLQGVDYWHTSTLDVRDDGTLFYTEPEVIEPLSELELSQLTLPSQLGFLDKNGDEYLNWTLTSSWTQSTLNRGLNATRGASQSVALEVSMPGSDLEFYKLTYRGEYYMPLYRSFTLRFRTELGYGDGYGETTELPFYEHFFAGGFGSVRGFESNTLGPRSTPAKLYRSEQPVTAIDADGNPTELANFLSYREVDGKLVVEDVNDVPDPFGGNVLIEGGVELIFPLPFIKDQRSIRSAFFVDAGNVFNTGCRPSQINCFDIEGGEIRVSVGVGVTWITGFGPMTFSLSKPLNTGPFDEEEPFQFTLGRGF